MVRYAIRSCSVRGYISAFPDPTDEEDLPRIVAHCDRSAGGMVEAEAPLFRDDDLAPDGGC